MQPGTIPDELLNLERLARWLDDQGLQPGAAISAAPLAGGASNAMFVIRRGSASWVLRRPALVPVSRANDGMRREYRILAALAGSDVPHARAVALCDDAGVLGCTFYLMQQVEGVSATAHEGTLEPGPVRTSVRGALVRSLARLHDFGWREAGLGTLGRPAGFHERQVERWTSQLNSYGADRLPGVLEVTSWLQQRIPASFEPALMHGDYHTMNVLLRFDNGPEVVAIIDWETTTIGDPLLDLAGFIETWTRRDRHAAGDEAAAIVSEYRLARSKAQESFDLTYYKVLYNFRLAVLLEGVYQRSLKDPSVVPKVQAGEEALNNLSRAVELIRQDVHGTAAAGSPA